MPEMEIKKTLLIIKSDPKSLGTAEAFLRNREWFVYSTNNLKEAMMFLVQKKPSFVMVAVDHPNKKVRALPKLIVQALPCCVIAYAETSSAKAFRFLQESGVEYRVNPPVTGPAIERTVNKYIKDQQAAEEKAKSHSVDSALREKKSGGLERGPVVMKGHDSPGASMPGTFVMKGEGPRGGALDAASLFRQMGIEMPDNGEGGGMPPGESARYGSIRTSAADVRSSEPGVIYGNDA
ncbi:MAG: hypothetical protein N2578_03150, partial [Bdellovibrionaceae bacterium]|nr:hypothetical protein [Pseudobdellovibrionaceae bacterium]